jgi:hypothetical protein
MLSGIGIGIVLLLVLASALGVASLGRQGRDALLRRAVALPNGAATATCASLDLGPVTIIGLRDTSRDYELVAPTLTTAQLPDTKTMTYDVIVSANSDLSGPTVYIAGAIKQTGTGGAGAAGQTFYFGLPSNTPRYVGFRATNSGAGDASGAIATLDVLQ